MLDTNIIFEAKRPQPDKNVLNWLRKQLLSSTYISVLSLGELEEGITLLGDTEQARDLRAWLGNLCSAYAGRILSVDQAVVSIWGQIRAHAKRQGKTAPVIDGLLAATAITHPRVDPRHPQRQGRRRPTHHNSQSLRGATFGEGQ